MPATLTAPPRRPRDLAALLAAHDQLATQVASLQAHDLPHDTQFAALVAVEDVVSGRHPRVAAACTRGAWLDPGDPHAPGGTCLVCTGQLP